MVGGDAGDGVDLARAGRQAPRHLDEQLVAHLVAQAVVDHLELVEIDEEQREPVLRIPVAARQAVRQAVGQQAPVGEAGERVVHRLEVQLLLGQLAVGDVGQRAGRPQRVAFGVVDRDPPAQHPAVAAVAVADAKLRREILVLAPQVRVDVGAQPRQIVGVHPVQPFSEPVADLALFVSQHRLPARRVVDAAGVDVPVPEPVVGPLGRQRVPVLGALALLDLGQKQLLGRPQRAVALVELLRGELHGPLDQLAVLVLLLIGVVHRLQEALELGAGLAAKVLPQLALQQSVDVRHDRPP